MSEDFKHLKHLQNLKLIRISSNKFIYLSQKFLVFTIIPLSLLLAGCNNEDENKAMDKKIFNLEKEAERNLIYKIQEQKSYFSKHKTFFTPPDEPATKHGSFPAIFGIQKCYHYYTETNADLPSKTTINAVYSYAVQDDCGGMWGLELRWYVGAVFAVPITGDKELKTISIVCQNIKSYGRVPSRPEYINGVVKCPSKTIQVY
ncbi:MAG: hypothetical protein AB3A66_04890 [Nodularia sp. CChRGM 3473]